MFFVISGFVLYGPFAAAHLRGQRGPGLAGYFRRRLFRIFPAYWVVLTVAIFGLHVVLVSGPGNAVENYSLIQSYFAADFTGLGPAWTLVIEVTFYAALPIYAMGLWHLGSRRRALAEFIGVAVLAVAGVCFASWSSFGNPPMYINVLPAYLTPFAVGMGLAVAHAWTTRQLAPPAWSCWMGARPWAYWAVAAAAWSSIVWALHYPSALSFARIPGHMAFEYSLILDVVGFCIVVPMVFGPQDQGRLRRGLQLRPVVFLGVISYAIYLWHVPLIDETSKMAARLHLTPPVPRFNFFAITGVILILTTIVAIASWYLVERPAIRFSRQGAAAYRSWWVTRRLFGAAISSAEGQVADGSTGGPRVEIDLNDQRHRPSPTARALLE